MVLQVPQQSAVRFCMGSTWKIQGQTNSAPENMTIEEELIDWQVSLI